MSAAPVRLGSWPYAQLLDLARKPCERQTLQLIIKIGKLWT
jgi:hypothetical protein